MRTQTLLPGLLATSVPRLFALLVALAPLAGPLCALPRQEARASTQSEPAPAPSATSPESAAQSATAQSPTAQSPAALRAWPSDRTRNWIGPAFWANRWQDWELADGRVSCVRPEQPWRTIHCLTHRLDAETRRLRATVRLGSLEGSAEDAFAGLLVGAGAPDLDPRAAALVFAAPGPHGGWRIGVDGTGRLVVQAFEPGAEPLQRVNVDASEAPLPLDDLRLELMLLRAGDGRIRLALAAFAGESRDMLALAEYETPDGDGWAGNLALVAHGGGESRRRFWFDEWRIDGEGLDVDAGRALGPVLATQYTRSRGVTRVTAQMMPLADDEGRVVLELLEGGQWLPAATVAVERPSYTAHFELAGLDAASDYDFRVRLADGSDEDEGWRGHLRRDPIDEDEFVVAGFTGNHNVRHGFGRAGFPFGGEALWFPHTDIVRNVRAHDPDLCFFSGDQVYEGASPTPPERAGRRAELDYLYKWALWCWAFRDLTADRPCVTIPDDHDVYQGNLWGASGRAAKRDHDGGYVMPADWVRMVERTQTSHLPAPFDPTPVEQGIGVYYTSLLVGGVDFAILEDRKFKSGPNGLCPPTTSGRPDHVVDPNFDPATADVEGAVLLGERQLAFLDHWAADWAGARMKCALSQTIFAGMATHHGAGLKYLVADYDSNAWPQSGRARALRALRRAFAFMIGGDQHLATLVHHGVEDWNDAGWSFCVPSIANFYPRAWRPPYEPHQRFDELPSDFAGEYLDGLGNKVSLWAETNPGVSPGVEPRVLHDSMPGYGIVRFRTRAREILVECWPRHAEVGSADARPYPGWPVLLTQRDQNGRRPAAWLPTLVTKGLDEPVVKVESLDGELLYALRAPNSSFRPWTFTPGTWRVRVGDPERGEWRILYCEAGPRESEVEIELSFE